MAVAPMLISHNTRCIASRARTSPTSVSPNAVNSCPSVIGTASWSCVRPILRIVANSRPFGAERGDQLVHRGDQADVAERHADVERGGVGVVGRLRRVHVIVRIAVLILALLVAHQLERPVGDHLVGVHVRRGARAALEHVEPELVVKLAVDDFLAGAFDPGEDLRVEPAALDSWRGPRPASPSRAP